VLVRSRPILEIVQSDGGMLLNTELLDFLL